MRRARPRVPRIAGERRAQRTLALLEVAAEEPVNAGRLPLNNAPGAVERFGLARHASVPRSEELGGHLVAQGEHRAQHVSALLREVVTPGEEDRRALQLLPRGAVRREVGERRPELLTRRRQVEVAERPPGAHDMERPLREEV
ncbi:MAG: hypothetical protein E6J69_17545 [Deltaproteobacteria bacterium]|nr:MAG: hypothetical protein E6J69_17545 [Deltaproteobacteria bacterium]